LACEKFMITRSSRILGIPKKAGKTIFLKEGCEVLIGQVSCLYLGNLSLRGNKMCVLIRVD
jgi:hypothetical protein